MKELRLRIENLRLTAINKTLKATKRLLLYFCKMKEAL